MKFIPVPAALAFAVSASLFTADASAQYTVKLGGAYFDTNASSTKLHGQLPAVSSQYGYLGNIDMAAGPSLEVQNKGTVTLTIERALTDHWSVELWMGNPPKHDVKLRTGALTLTPTATLAGGNAGRLFEGFEGTKKGCSE